MFQMPTKMVSREGTLTGTMCSLVSGLTDSPSRINCTHVLPTPHPPLTFSYSVLVQPRTPYYGYVQLAHPPHLPPH